MLVVSGHARRTLYATPQDLPFLHGRGVFGSVFREQVKYSYTVLSKVSTHLFFESN